MSQKEFAGLLSLYIILWPEKLENVELKLIRKMSKSHNMESLQSLLFKTAFKWRKKKKRDRVP